MSASSWEFSVKPEVRASLDWKGPFLLADEGLLREDPAEPCAVVAEGGKMVDEMGGAAPRSGRCGQMALVATLAGLLLAAPAGAALIERDLFAPGDGLLTFDTDTNLEWLDITATLNLSYDDIMGGAGGYVAAGFGFATTPQVETLWTNAGIVDTSGALVAGNRAAAELLLLLMGCTASCGTGSDAQQGQAEFDPVQVDLNSPFIQLGGGVLARANIDPGFTQARDFRSPTLGNYLIRVAPGPFIAVEIDIKPGIDPNLINLFRWLIIPVALLGSDDFDVSDADATTLAFGPRGAAPAFDGTGPRMYRLSQRDVNGDGKEDLLSFYCTRETGIAFGDTRACLTGETLDGTPFGGCDAIQTLPDCGFGFGAGFLLLPPIWLRGWRRRRLG